MSAQDTIRLLQALNAPVQQAGADYVKQATTLPNQSVLNPGQKPMDLLTNPTAPQNRGLLAASLQMMAHDPRKMPGETIQKAFQQGFGTMDQMRAQQQEAKTAGAKGRYEVATDQRDFMAEGMGLTRAPLGPLGGAIGYREQKFIEAYRAMTDEEKKEAGLRPNLTDFELRQMFQKNNIPHAAGMEDATTRARTNAEGEERTQISEVDAGLAQGYEAMDAFEMASSMAQSSKEYLDMIDSGELDTGPMDAILLSVFGVGTEQLAAMDAQAVEQTLQNLQITNLAPVTVQELRTVAKLWAQAHATPTVNKGILKRAIRKAERAMEYARRDARLGAERVRQNGSPLEYERLLKTNPFVSEVVGSKGQGSNDEFAERLRRAMEPLQ